MLAIHSSTTNANGASRRETRPKHNLLLERKEKGKERERETEQPWSYEKGREGAQ